MARRSIFEIIEERYDIEEELNTISDLFYSDLILVRKNSGIRDYYAQESIENMADMVFHKWSGRRTCVSCKDMRKRLNLIKKPNTDDIDVIASYLEYYMNIIILFELWFKDDRYNIQYTANYSIMNDNIISLLSNINHRSVKENDLLSIVPDNASATAVAEISSKPIAFAILKYNHALLKGNLKEKKDLLLAIAHEYEALFKKPIDGHTRLFEAITKALNNLNIRHNNLDEKDKANYKSNLKSMSAKNIEFLYDELYQMMLFAILAEENRKQLPEVEDMLKKVCDTK